MLLSPESRSINGISAFSTFGSVWFVISALRSARSYAGCSVDFSRSVKVLVFSSFSETRSLALSSDKTSAGQF